MLFIINKYGATPYHIPEILQYSHAHLIKDNYLKNNGLRISHTKNYHKGANCCTPVVPQNPRHYPLWAQCLEKSLYFIYLSCNTVPPASVYHWMPALRSTPVEQLLHCEENGTACWSFAQSKLQLIEYIHP